MAIDVITQGGGEGLVYAFNAVASIFNGKRALGASLVYIAGSFATVLMVMTMVAKQELLPTIKWFFGSLMITSALMVPKVDIIIKDRLTHLERPVANVPFMLGTFAGIASQLGDVLAKQMDAIFSKAGPDYRGNGVAMASQLLSKVNHFHIRDPLMASNVRGFVQQCMVFDIAKGKYTIKELHRTDDVWKLLKDNASPARGFVYKKLEEDTQKKSKKPVQSKIVTCLEGANAIEQEWAKAYKEASIAYGSRLYPNSTRASSLFLDNLPLAHQYLTKLSHTAERILQQSMMSNAIDDGLLELNQLTDANAAVTAYAAKRAQAQQRVAYSLQGNMASLSLSVLKVVVEILFYGLFPIIVAISIFPGGWMMIKKYLIALFWIQSWAPMYAILNMIMNVYGKAKSTAVITSAGKGALNLYALRGLSEANDWISSAAGYTMMSVPFLSYGIIHYGAGALSQLSTHFGSVTQSAASHAAEEATTGNYSMGNTSFDSHNRHNISGFKHDTNVAVATNKTSVQNADGSLSTRMPNGQGIIDISPAIPKINSQIRISDSLASSFNESANHSSQMGVTKSQSAGKNVSAAFGLLDEYRKNRSADKQSGTTFSAQDQAFKESSLSKYDELVNEFAKSHNINESNSRELFGTIGGKIPGTVISGGLKIGNSYVDANTVRDATSFHEKNSMAEVLRKSVSEMKEGRLNLSDSEGKNHAGAITAHLNEALNQMESAQANFSEADSYQQQAAYIQQNGLSIDQDLSKPYWDSLVTKVGLEQAKEIVSDPVKNYAHLKQFSNDKRDELRRQFEKQSPVNASTLEQKYQVASDNIKQQHNVHDYAALNKQVVDKTADSAGLNTPVGSDLQLKVENSLNVAGEELNAAKQELLEKGNKLKPKTIQPSEKVNFLTLPPD